MADLKTNLLGFVMTARSSAHPDKLQP